MPKQTITKIKTAFSLNKDVMKAVEYKSLKFNVKKSQVVNDILRHLLLDTFETADKLMQERKDNRKLNKQEKK